jgi:glycosyltransferase involved in cell wall biosynthesis
MSAASAPAAMSRPGAPYVPYVHRTQHRGVEAVHIDATVNCLRALGYEVDVVAPNAPAAAAAQSTGRRSLRSRLLGVVSTWCPEFVFELLELAYNIPAALELWRRTRRPTWAIFERYAIFAVAATCVARRRNIPLVIEVSYTASMPLVRRRSRVLRPLALQLDRFVLRRAALILAVSSFLREHLINDLGVEARRILVLPNAADPRAFDPSQSPIERVGTAMLAGRKVVGFVGTFAPWHGLRLLLEAFVALAPRHPDAVLLLVGDGPERASLERLSAEAGLAERVLFAGTVPHRDLPRYVAAFRIAVLPDTNTYGSPMKIFEYMAMGRAIVAPDYGPVVDVMRPGENGLVFARQDRDSLSAALETLLLDEAAVWRLGQGARRTVVDRHNWMRNTVSWISALEGLGAPRISARSVPDPGVAG